jgi:mono/diheme cytochrome c family protein
MRYLWRGGFAAIVFFLIAAYFLRHHDWSTRSEPGAIETYIATNLRYWSVPAVTRDLKNPEECSGRVVAEAKEHWADHCATCHGNNGSGATLFGKTMYPRPPDMRLPETQRQSDGMLYYTIKNGVRLTGMPAFGEPGDQDEASWKLVCFVRHLPQIDIEEEHQMRKLNPKSPADLEEERQEEEFLKGGASPKHSQHHH